MAIQPDESVVLSSYLKALQFPSRVSISVSLSEDPDPFLFSVRNKIVEECQTTHFIVVKPTQVPCRSILGIATCSFPLRCYFLSPFLHHSQSQDGSSDSRVFVSVREYPLRLLVHV